MSLQLSEKPLLEAEAIQKRIAVLATEIEKEYPCDLLVGVLTGAFIFVADLVRQMNPDIKLAFVKAESYGDSDTSCGDVRFAGIEKMNVKDKRILVIDDILDTGHTLNALTKLMQDLGAISVKSCVLLDKPSRREVAFEADFKGFVIENLFAVGYGLDYADNYRALPAIYTLQENEEPL